MNKYCSRTLFSQHCHISKKTKRQVNGLATSRRSYLFTESSKVFHDNKATTINMANATSDLSSARLLRIRSLELPTPQVSFSLFRSNVTPCVTLHPRLRSDLGPKPVYPHQDLPRSNTDPLHPPVRKKFSKTGLWVEFLTHPTTRVQQLELEVPPFITLESSLTHPSWWHLKPFEILLPKPASIQLPSLPFPKRAVQDIMPYNNAAIPPPEEITGSASLPCKISRLKVYSWLI